jgi:predicted nucleic acid-binding protein
VTAPSVGLVDTSVFIARETGRELDLNRMPDEISISVVTVGELHVGVHVAPDIETRAQRLATLFDLGEVDVIDIDADVCLRWALLRAHMARVGRRANVNDLWIAATALRHNMPVVTQDADFDPLVGIGGLSVIRL